VRLEISSRELFLLQRYPFCFPSQALPQAAILQYVLDDPYVEIVHEPRADLRNVDSNSQFSPEACTIFRQLIRCSFDVPEPPRVSARYQQQEALETAIFSPRILRLRPRFKRTGRPAGRTWREYSPGGQRNNDSSDPATLAGRTSHSERRAISGFTCVARRAGNKHAARPATRMTSTTAEKVHGSVPETPRIWLAITRVNARLIITPASAPAVTLRARSE
jgi:hypothetical protein